MISSLTNHTDCFFIAEQLAGIDAIKDEVDITHLSPAMFPLSFENSELYVLDTLAFMEPMV